jgi:RNA polymerase sigma-70 factor, ECF subfamily
MMGVMESRAAVATEDAVITAGIVAGESRAEDEFVQRFLPRIQRMIGHALSSHHEAEDLAQETVKGALESLRRGHFRGDCALGTFVHAVARNKIAEFIRRKKPAPSELTDDTPDLKASPEDDLARQEMARAVREVLDRLRPNCRDVLYLYYYQGLGVSEIASRLAVPARKVTEWKEYGLRVIRGRYEDHLQRFR